MISVNLSDISISSITKGSDNRCNISLISKNEAINLTKNADLTKKKRSIIKHKRIIFIYKMGKKHLTVWRYWNWENQIL